MITLTQLEYIVAIDEYRHFATAAEKCFVTQPTLSMQIKKLEEELGVIIFDRSRQPIVPTDIGKKLIEQARITLSASRRMHEIVNEDLSQVTGELKIGIIPTLAPYLLPMFIGQYTRKYPNVSVKVEELVSEDIIRRLKHDTLDVGIFVTPYGDEKILENPLFYEEMFLYLHPEHPFMQFQEVDVKSLNPSEIWMLGDGHCFRNQVINLCGKTDESACALPFLFESDSIETLMRIVDTEGGCTLIPELALHYMPDSKLKQVRPFKDSKPLREVSVIFSRHFTKQSLIQLLCEEIRHCVPTEMLDLHRGTIVRWKCKMR